LTSCTALWHRPIVYIIAKPSRIRVSGVRTVVTEPDTSKGPMFDLPLDPRAHIDKSSPAARTSDDATVAYMAQ